ncbi:MAG: HAMP domain-containing sensor histidine kinase [Bacteroidales bacterium]|nr:HAMP domain-containing sensor histidine kinase [Bacteroidales bacterium]
MDQNNWQKKIPKFLYNILEIGTSEQQFVLVKQRIIYFNVILLALPLVYFLFVLIDIKSFIKPLDTWYLDQVGFFIFVFICLLCFYLNHLKWSNISKILFIVSWPLILHIAPIIIQHTPSDYYFAFPIGLIFHSVLIQTIFSRKKSPFLFWTFLVANFILMLNFLKILQYFDTDGDTELNFLANDEYFVKVVILYWLLFNIFIFLILVSIDKNLLKISNSKNIIEDQKDNLEDALDKLQKSTTQLIRTEKLSSLGIFTAGISHELNNPINYISSGTSALFNIFNNIEAEFKDKNSLGKEYFKDIKEIRNAIEIGVHKASMIVSSLRNYAHSEEGNFMKYNSINCLRDAIILLTSGYKGGTIIHQNFPEQIELYCKPGKLNQAFFNLIHNAIEASGNKKDIYIEASLNGNDEAVFVIKDEGCGIDKTILGKIFDPFFTTKEVGKGTGLGLYIVHAIIEEHHGKIEVLSEPGKGTKFIVKIPINQHFEAN